MARETKRLLLVAALAVGGALAFAATAYACTPLADIDVDERAGVVGQAITGSGDGFSPVGGEVHIHFNAADGNAVPVWSGKPNAEGELRFSFEVPKVAPGYYTVTGTQMTPTGEYVAREAFRVLPPPSAAPEPEPAGQGSSSGPTGGGSTATAPRQTRATNSAPAVTSAGPATSAGSGRSAVSEPAATSARRAARSASGRAAPAPVRDPQLFDVAARDGAFAPAPGGGAPDLAPDPDRSVTLAFGLLGLAVLLSIAGLALVLARRRSGEQAAAVELHTTDQTR